MTRLLDVENLAKSYAGLAAVRHVSFGLDRGEILAMIGPNGAGKSTCFNMLNGQIRPDAGRIRIDGVDTTGLPPRAVWRKGVGRTFQITATFGSMTVRENVQVALMSHGGALGRWFGRADTRGRDEADRLLALVGMAADADRAAAELAYGDLKRLELAVALANRPKLLLMDEPTAGMAPRERVGLMRLTAEIARAEGIGVLFTEHDMDVVFEHADRMMVLSRGLLIAEGPPEMVRRDPEVRAIYLGEGLVYDARHQEARADASPSGPQPEARA
ncbi:MAG: ABC transporter ATP-binding protein [Rhodovulum sp.]|nr:ABC transporter ATP-binding protein [Rhodovulum sp.]